MSDNTDTQPTKHAPGEQGVFMQSTYQEFDQIYRHPKTAFWDSEEGEQDKKSELAAKVLTSLMYTMLAAGIVVILSLINRGMAKNLSDSSVLLASICFIAGFGYMLLSMSDIRKSGAGPYLYGIFGFFIAVFCGCLIVTFGSGRVMITMFLSKVCAAICMYYAAQGTKKFENFKKNMAVAFVMAMFIIILCVVYSETKARYVGAVGGATCLALSMLAGGAMIFYVSFAIVIIQMPEAEASNELDDYVYYSIRIFIDALYAVFLLVALIWDKVWKKIKE